MESINRTLSLPIRVLVIASLLSLLLQTAVQAVLNGFYERSGYPVPYFVGQTSFDAGKLEGWYASMDAAGTLGIYWQTQFVDFGFIVATALLHFSLLMLVARLLSGAWRRVALWFVLAGLLAPVFDALENLASFIALANPSEISPVVAVVYSGFAVLKFAGFFAVYLWVPVGLVAAAVLRIARPAAAIQPAR